MKFGNGFTVGRNQLQWVVVLLAAAVVLPTVSLLWFISRVISNERLVVREKLTTVYEGELAEAAQITSQTCAAKLQAIDDIESSANPYLLFKYLVLEHGLEGVIILDENDKLVYPVSADVVADSVSSDEKLADARRLEFTDGKYAQAVQQYDRFANDPDPVVAVAAIMGKSRCLSRLGRLDEAIEQCRQAAFGSLAENSNAALPVANARLMLLTLLKRSAEKSGLAGVFSQERPELFLKTISALIEQLYNDSADHTLLPANQNLFIAGKVLKTIEDIPSIKETLAADANKLEKLVAAEQLSFSVAQSTWLARRPTDRFFRIKTDEESAYGLWHQTHSNMLLLLCEDRILAALSGYKDIFELHKSAFRLVDASGAYVAGIEQPQGKPFISVALAECFPGWNIELYLEGSSVFDEAAEKQIAVYIWTGALVILLILFAGGFAAQAVGKQIRLNKMKNDFIATVSHELKTPLASMRVLIDTLLEGNVKDESQADEYLRLTAKENERLSRMIDNFLTFSRMERNKKAFTLEPTYPAGIADDAAEAFRTKLAAGRCNFAVDISDNLPQLQADHDAMVTVLVNLLDNAFKYTPDPKQIDLKVTAENDNVCFAVSDNGIGLSHRQIRKIFDSFYQVDSSLARSVEGCGLGLSIVKFIVDAHKGKISVDSKVGKGSTFTVRIPVYSKTKD